MTSEKDYPDYLNEFPTNLSDESLIAFIDERIVAALPEGWSVITPDAAERRRHAGIQDYEWHLYEGTDDDSNYVVVPVDRKRVALIYGNAHAGAFKFVEHAMQRSAIFPTAILAPVLDHVFNNREQFPVNVWDLS